MADDNTSRFRSSNPLGHGTGPSGPANDPLAELARLIGRSDPFADFGPRPRAPQPEHGPQGVEGQTFHDSSDPAEPDYGQPDQELPEYEPPAEPYAAELAPSYSPEPPPAYSSEPLPAYSSEPPPAYSSEPLPSYSPEPAAVYGRDPAQPYQPHVPPRFVAEPQPHDDWPGSPPPVPAFLREPEPYGLPPPIRPLPGFETPADSEPLIRPPDDFRTERTPFDPLPGFMTATDHSDDRQPYGQQPPMYPMGGDGGAMPSPHDDKFYDDAPRGNRRKGLLTVAAVLALAVVGTAGAVGYRNYFSGARSSGPPPVIRASGEPSKVAPPQSSAAVSSDPSANKFNFDRFADRGKDEQVIKREEKPIDQKELARTNPPRTILEGAPSSSSRSPSIANPPSTIGDPKRVRTVPIRPDQGDVAATTPSTTPETLLQAPPLRQSSNFPPPPASPGGAPETKPEPAAPPPAARSAPPRTVTASRGSSAPSTSGNGPLSLNPDASPPPQASAYRDTAPPSQPAPSSRQASAAPAPAPAPRASSGGRFHVQVSSQKSESDAEASYRSIQSKYSSVLSGQPHTVRRADLGSKGVYYRAMVGPFASREQAVQLCSSLKSAGGDCVVQAN